MDIIFEDLNYLVINKASGQSVHNDDQSVIAKLSSKNLYPVHRLDKETSGLLVLGKSKTAAKSMHELWQEVQTEKEYLGIILDPKERASDSNIVFSQKIGQSSGGFKNIKGPKPWVEAITHVKVLASDAYLSKLKFKIETGRTHQIRKHCALNWGPILNDRRYSSKKQIKIFDSHYPNIPMCLHSFQIKVGEYFWEAPEPKYLELPFGS